MRGIRKIPHKGYWISLREGKFEEVKGKGVEIEGFDGFDFFIYKPEGSKAWKVSEGITGNGIGLLLGTQKEAVDEAKRILDKEGIKGLSAAMRAAIKESGISPRWKK